MLKTVFSLYRSCAVRADRKLHLTYIQIQLNFKEEYVRTICYKQKVETWHQTLTFLEGTKMLRKYSKISVFNILKTSLPLKMSKCLHLKRHDNYVIPHYYSIDRLKILITLDSKY